MRGAADPAAVMLLSKAIEETLKAVIATTDSPAAVFHAIPETLSGLAGSYILTMARNKVLADGEQDQLLARCLASTKDHADPEQNPQPRNPPRDLRALRAARD